jgi:hypothetical protein
MGMENGKSKTTAAKKAVVKRASLGHALQVRSAEGRAISKSSRKAAAAALKAAT